ncbi:MAG: hypothetical protein P4L28_06075 [Paludibacteraceae bacterium]|nr:hypothetical protein [Paludibacteraceae bacterium]
MSFVPLIIIAVLLILSSIRKKSKADSQQNIPPNPTPSTPNTWAEILRELGKTEMPASQPATTKEPDITAAASPIIEKKNRTPETESMPQFKQKETATSINGKSPIKDTEIQDYEPEYSLNDPDTLRKAVVYAEILNRKYC